MYTLIYNILAINLCSDLRFNDVTYIFSMDSGLLKNKFSVKVKNVITLPTGTNGWQICYKVLRST